MNGETNIQTGLVKELSVPLYNCKGWLKLVGVMFIIFGAIVVWAIVAALLDNPTVSAGVTTSLTSVGIAVLIILGILFAWLPIWNAVLLFQSANAIGQAYETDSKPAMTRSLSKLKTYFIIMGIFTLIEALALLGYLYFACTVSGGQITPQ